MKGIILAGGSGSRLYPMTIPISKQLCSISQKPLIYYPLTTLLQMGIEDILIISDSENLPSYRKLLQRGEQFGIRISYAIQDEPEGIAQALLIGEKFVDDDKFCLILGDNIYYSSIFEQSYVDVRDQFNHLMLYEHMYPQRFGVADIDDDGDIRRVVEKPDIPLSNKVVTGMYFFYRQAIEAAKQIKKSPRGEYEITDVVQKLIDTTRVTHTILKPPYDLWCDVGITTTFEATTRFIDSVYTLTSRMIGCPHEAALKQGFIKKVNMLDFLQKNKLLNSEYGKYVERLCE